MIFIVNIVLLLLLFFSAGLSPSGQLPVLEFDGKVLTQSKVILSYVAKELSKSCIKQNQAIPSLREFTVYREQYNTGHCYTTN